jgi:hypothetical protein
MKCKMHLMLSGILMALVLTGCDGVVVEPQRAAENKAVLSEIRKVAEGLGLKIGGIRKSCAIPFGCSANDFYESITYIVGPTLTDEIICSRFVKLADSLGYTSSWTSYHPEEGPGGKVEDLAKVCIETIGINDGVGNTSQSEAVVFVGSKVFEKSTVNYWVQVQSMVQPDGAPEGERGYYFSISTFE